MVQFAARSPAPAVPDRRLSALLAPALAPVFARPPSEAAAWGHGPFANWLVQAARPRRVAVAGLPGRGAAAVRDAASRLQPPAEWVVAPAPAIDLLLIEQADDAAAALAGWSPCLTARAILLLHGPASQSLFESLRRQHPHFSFAHAGGLGVVALGAAVADPLASLCRLADPADIAACRARFALLGDAWEAAAALAELPALRRELEALRSSSSWRLTAPLRVAVTRLRGTAAAAVPVPPPRAATPPPRPGAAPRVLFVAGEPDTPGALYRCARPAAAAAAAGWRAGWRALDGATAAEAARADVLVLWRTAWDDRVERLVSAAHRAGSRVVLDLDDLLWDATLAPAAARGQALRMRRTIAAADALFASTVPLAAHLRAAAGARPVWVLANGFDAQTHARARRAVRARRPDGRLRLGYAAGTSTHQKDFAVAAPAVAELLRTRPEARLVLFRGAGGAPLLDPADFPDLAACAAQIEWRQAVALDDLPDELARFDINLAPLLVGEPFCEAKSELKYFEAALVDVPTVASPTAPMAAAIRDGVTGLLAREPDAWGAALHTLAAQPELRRRLAAAAYRDVILRFGPELRVDRVAAALDAVLTA